MTEATRGVTGGGPACVVGAASRPEPERSRRAMLGVALALTVLVSSSDPWTFTVGRVGVAAMWAALAYACLAAAAGRAERLGARVVGLMVVLSLATWVALLAVADRLPTGGPLASCEEGCPENPLRLSSAAPWLVSALSAVAVALVVAAWLATIALLAVRLRRASALERRALSPGLVATCALLVTGIPALVLREIGVQGAGAQLLAAAGVAAVAAFPLCLLVGFVRRRLHVGAALRDLIARLAAERPTPARLRTVLAETLEDPTLDLAYWLPARARYIDASGIEVKLPPTDGGRAVTYVRRDDTPIAAILHDPALAKYADLLGAAGDAAALALDNARLEAELRATIRELSVSRTRMLAVADADRRRLERDLHDGAQQRLIALRMDIARAGERLHGEDEMRATLDLLSVAAGHALDDLRELVSGVYPTLLVNRGVVDALEAAALMSPLRVLVTAPGLGRFAPEVEAAVYFCCVEALQNAGKHAGRAARVDVRVRRDGGRLAFEVSDDGRGFDVRAARGAGVTNMRDRVAAAGGELAIESSLGRGTTVRGHVPLRAVVAGAG